MTYLHKKLHSQSGASIILALLLFLICGFVASVTLGSAAVNSRKFAEQREQQQIYLSISSAAQLLSDSLSGNKMEGVEEQTVYQHTDNALLNAANPIPALELPVVTDNNKDKLTITTGSSSITELVMKGFLEIYKDRLRYETRTPFPPEGTWERVIDIDADQMKSVSAKISINKSGLITAYLYLKDDIKNSSSYSMTLTFKTTIDDKSIEEDYGTCHHTITITDEFDPTHTAELTIDSPVKHDTHTVTFEIGQGEIRKGK